MNKGLETLSEITTWSKYAKYVPDLKRRENWTEIVQRYLEMMNKKYPQLAGEIWQNGNYILEKKVLPSMRALQFAGLAIDVNPARLYNCAFYPVDHYKAFSEAMFLLLGGTGVGYSVQFADVAKLPEISKPTKKSKYVIQDSIVGWADAVKVLMKSYLGYSKTLPIFDFRDIRPKGARLITAGGKAPGAEPLKECLFQVQKILDRKENGEKLTPLECHDIMCHIANSVLSGGIRRAALISLFSFDDEEMLTCKHGAWWELNSQRGRANNSAVIVRNRITKEEFLDLWKKVETSNSGEPGISWTNNPRWGFNPCFTSDTKILTPTGYVEIGKNVGELELMNKNGEIINGKIWSNGFKDVVEVKTSQKIKIKCTPDHRFMITTEEECMAKDLVGKRLMPYFSIDKEVSEYTKYGFIQGDGCLGRLSSSSHKGLEINIGEDDFDIFELFGIPKENNKTSYYLSGYNEILKVLKFDDSVLPYRTLPKTFLFWEQKDKLMFLKGMFSANGCIIKNQRIAYKTTSKKLAQELQETLLSLNISSYITTNKEKEVLFSNGNYTCKESYDVNISKYESVLAFANKIAFVHEYKNKALKELILEKAPKVMSVKEAGNEEVFDFNLQDDTHWGVIEGVIAHNCHEVSLRPFQFCNLCELNASSIETQEDFNKRAKVAAFFGTLQAGFTDFHYLRLVWKETTEKDALIGVGITGIASQKFLELDEKIAAEIVKKENERVAEIIEINKAARTTVVKPSGSTSCVLGTSSGIHAWHDKYFLRTTRYNKNDALAQYLLKHNPEICEVDEWDSKTICVRLPVAAPDDAITREESAFELLERVKRFNINWVKQGHRKGDNINNVSATISIKPEQWKEIGEWMWDNRNYYSGISVLPFDNGSYVQAPFETLSEEQFQQKLSELKHINVNEIFEEEDFTDQKAEAACSGGACELV